MGRAERAATLSPKEYYDLVKQLNRSVDEKLLEIKEACKYSLRLFSFFIVGSFTRWGDFWHEEDEQGNATTYHYSENWHLLVWYRLMEQYTRLCVLCARGHGKTWAFSITYPLWRMWKDPGSQGLLFSNTEAQAAANLDMIKRIIENNPVLASLRPAKPQKWGQLEIRADNQSGLRVLGQGASARGAHPDYIVEDDILDEKNCNTTELKDKTKNWHYSVVEPMLLGSSKLFVVGTPQAYDDLLMELKDNPQYKWVRFPARIEQEEKDKLMRLL